MKNIKIIFFSLAFLTAGLSLSSCADNSATDKQGKEYTSEYVCPMHCEGSGSDKAGKCPVCGMTYVENENHTKEDGHSH
jgi:Heavy metal binding domain